MAVILKYSKPNQKGILVFSHKELAFFHATHSFFKPTYGRRIRLKKAFSGIFQKPRKHPTAKIQETLTQIKQHYFIGVHFGWSQQNFPDFGILDFCLGSKNGMSIDSERMAFIPLNSRNFISRHFYLENPKQHTKIWDVLMVSRDAKFKNLDKFLKTIRKIYDNGEKIKVLLIVPSNPIYDKDDNVTYVNLLNDHLAMFSYQERESFSIIKMHPAMPLLGMPQGMVSHFYHLSKVLAMFSENEGSSKVISEALLAGLKVVACDRLTGGGRDYLNDNNSVLFNDFSNAGEALMRGLDLYESTEYDESIADLVHEDKSMEKLKSYFKTLYAENDQQFDGDLDCVDRLCLRLPSFWTEGLPWAGKPFLSPDIKTIEQLNLFVKELKL